MKILLVEPNYKTKYPPLGLLKLSSYHKDRGDDVTFTRGTNIGLEGTFDRIYVTSLWTWAWREVWNCVRYYIDMYPESEVWLGGIYASLMPEHAEGSGADVIHQGLCERAEHMMPDYDILPYEWNKSIVYATRGCKYNCDFCLVPQLEGKLELKNESIKELIHPDHEEIVFFDNDITSHPNLDHLFEEIKEIGKKVDFNQGLKASNITEELAQKLTEIRMVRRPKVRLAYDSLAETKVVKRAIENLHKVGIVDRDIVVYMLYNFRETPDEFFERLKNVINWGAMVYPMHYRPLNTLEKNVYVNEEKGWTKDKVHTVHRARRVWGFKGNFIPYGFFKDHINSSDDFNDAFKKFSREIDSKTPDGIENMDSFV